MSGPLTPETPSRESMAAIAAWMRSRRGLAPVDATRAPTKRLPTMSAGPESKRGGITGYDIPEPSLTSRALEAGASWLPPVDVPLAMRGAKKAIGGDMKGGAGMMALSMAGMVPAGKLIAKGAEAVGVKALEHAAAPASRGIEAWHGSPVRGIDRFSLDKIGTGEGNQSFGHGLYFAENPTVAKEYQQALAQTRLVKEGAEFKVPMRDPYDRATPESMALAWVDDAVDNKAEFPYHRAIQNIRNSLGFDEAEKTSLENVIRGWEANGVVPERKGGLYKVQLDAHPDDLLDYDAPLRSQPAIEAKVRPLVEPYIMAGGFNGGWDGFATKRKGKDVLDEIKGSEIVKTKKAVDPSVVSQKLKEAGIPGLKYLDGGSRASGEGTRNYVMWDEERIKILQALGLAGLVGGGYAKTQRGDTP